MAKVLLATDAGPSHTWSLLRVFLESQGHAVSAVHDGEAVLAAVPADRPEIIILDTALPTLNGFQVLARLQQRQEPGRLPVLVISMHDESLFAERVLRAGAHATPVIERFYFRSIYFREPSGVLFEIADDGPGFTVDGPVEDLGSRIILPPFLEDRRAEIEARLTPLPDPRTPARG